MDSLADLSLLNGFPRERVLRFPRDKDETDTEIGLRVMREMGCGSVTIAGGGGGRIDHLLGIVNLFEREQPPKRWVTDGEDIFLVEGTAEFDARAGQTVSIFPVGSVAARMASTGLRWDLDELEFRRGFPGLSNRALGGPVRLSVGIGKLLVIKLLSEER
jgi:thiamine pyrophosphokinase